MMSPESLNVSIESINPEQAAGPAWAYPSRNISWKRTTVKFGRRALKGVAVRFIFPSLLNKKPWLTSGFFIAIIIVHQPFLYIHGFALTGRLETCIGAI